MGVCPGGGSSLDGFRIKNLRERKVERVVSNALKRAYSIGSPRRADPPLIFSCVPDYGLQHFPSTVFLVTVRGGLRSCDLLRHSHSMEPEIDCAMQSNSR
jgi:hypothetical protein